MKGPGIIIRDGHHGTCRAGGEIDRGAWGGRIGVGVVRPEEHIHLAALTDPGNGDLVGSQRDGGLSLGIEDDGVLVRADCVLQEGEPEAVGDARIRGIGDGVVVVRQPGRIGLAVGLAVERGGGRRIAKKKEQLSILLK